VEAARFSSIVQEANERIRSRVDDDKRTAKGRGPMNSRGFGFAVERPEGGMVIELK
jgi:hypothetical protein